LRANNEAELEQRLRQATKVSTDSRVQHNLEELSEHEMKLVNLRRFYLVVSEMTTIVKIDPHQNRQTDKRRWRWHVK